MNIIHIVRRLKGQLINWNLFENESSHSNPYHYYTAIIATRIYIVLLLIAMTILVIFLAFGHQTQIGIIRNPSQATFEYLYSKYPSTLQCACSMIDIPYGSYLTLTYQLHPVCSSVFVSEVWINLLYKPNMGYFYPLDFRATANSEFRLLLSLCSFINQTIQDAINDMLSDAALNPQILSFISLQQQIELQIKFLQNSTMNEFQRLLYHVRSATHISSLQSALQTAKSLLLYNFDNQLLEAYPTDNIWASTDGTQCFCSTSSTCSAPSAFFDLYTFEYKVVFNMSLPLVAYVPGFVVGCFALDSLLQSSLECFFNQTCLDMVFSYFSENSTNHFNALNISETKYNPETTIQTLCDNLFIETLSSGVSFSSYYSQCAPISCTYTFAHKNSPLYIITTLLGLYGGLTVALRFIVFCTVKWWRNRKQNTQTDSVARADVMAWIPTVLRKIRGQMIGLFTFRRDAMNNDSFESNISIISFGIYLLLMLLSMIIIAIYLFTYTRIQTVSIRNPSLMNFEQLYDTYPNTVQCPCSRIAILYKSFTTLSPKFHPICSSFFISDDWIISIIASVPNDADYEITDFRLTGPVFFNTLTTLCSLSEKTVNDSWYAFIQTPFITDQAISASEFQIRTHITIEKFKQNTITSYESTVNLIETHTKNMYATGYEDIRLFPEEWNDTNTRLNFKAVPVEENQCSCTLYENCQRSMAFYNYTDIMDWRTSYMTYNIPSIIVGCFVLSSVYQSSLECFFNRTCLNTVGNDFGSEQIDDIPVLETNATRFSPNELIGTFANNLMVDTWNENVSFAQYYQQCAPEYCTFSYKSRDNPLKVIAILIGLFGGISIALKIISKLTVVGIQSYLRRRTDLNNITNRLSCIDRIRACWHWLKIETRNINLFRNELSRDNSQLSEEIIATRIYISLLVIAILILIIYNLIAIQVQTITIQNPSETTFDELRRNLQYAPVLDCRCQNINIFYSSFISATPTYHQLCSSDFVNTSSGWISQLYSPHASVDYAYDDFRIFAAPQFQLLASLCVLAKKEFNEAINRFNSNTLVTERVQFREIIEAKANNSLKQFFLSTTTTFVRVLDFILLTSHGNLIVSSILSNWQFILFNIERLWSVARSEPLSYGNCSCGNNAMCTSQAAFDGLIVPGFFVGCYPLEALLQSTLECLYNTSCIDLLSSMYNSSNVTIKPLDSMLSSPNATVQSLVNVLFVDRWDTKVNYSDYYVACAPLSCTYTRDEQTMILYIVASIIGLYGGLTVVLKLIVPMFMKIRRYVTARCQNRVRSDMTIIET